MSVSAIVTGYQDLASLKLVVRKIRTCSLDRIILAVGGNDGSIQYANSIVDSRVVVLEESRRMGKIAALRRALEFTKSDFIFLICSDVDFDPQALWRMLDYMSTQTGAVVPKVVPANRDNMVSRVASTLWHIRNNHLLELEKKGYVLHGGEVLLTRRSVLDNLPNVVNDDAYICLRASEMGYRTRYAGNVTIKNRVPDTISDLIMQRVRVNFGHVQLKNFAMKPSVMTNLFMHRPGMFARVLFRTVTEKKSSIILIPAVVIVEALSILFCKRDMRRKLDYTIWPMVG